MKSVWDKPGVPTIDELIEARTAMRDYLDNAAVDMPLHHAMYVLLRATASVEEFLPSAEEVFGILARDKGRP